MSHIKHRSMNVNKLKISIPPLPYDLDCLYESQEQQHHHQQPHPHQVKETKSNSGSVNKTYRLPCPRNIDHKHKSSNNNSFNLSLNSRLEELTSQISQCEALVKRRRINDSFMTPSEAYTPPLIIERSNTDIENELRVKQLSVENEILKSALVSLKNVVLHEVHTRESLEKDVARLSTRLSCTNITKRKYYETNMTNMTNRRQRTARKTKVLCRQQLDRTLHYELPDVTRDSDPIFIRFDRS